MEIAMTMTISQVAMTISQIAKNYELWNLYYLYASILYGHFIIHEIYMYKGRFSPLIPNFRAGNKKLLDNQNFAGKHCLSPDLSQELTLHIILRRDLKIG